LGLVFLAAGIHSGDFANLGMDVAPTSRVLIALPVPYYHGLLRPCFYLNEQGATLALSMDRDGDGNAKYKTIRLAETTA
jgi:hypothetical protein